MKDIAVLRNRVFHIGVIVKDGDRNGHHLSRCTVWYRGKANVIEPCLVVVRDLSSAIHSVECQSVSLLVTEFVKSAFRNADGKIVLFVCAGVGCAVLKQSVIYTLGVGRDFHKTAQIFLGILVFLFKSEVVHARGVNGHLGCTDIVKVKAEADTDVDIFDMISDILIGYGRVEGEIVACKGVGVFQDKLIVLCGAAVIVQGVLKACADAHILCGGKRCIGIVDTLALTAHKNSAGIDQVGEIGGGFGDDLLLGISAHRFLDEAIGVFVLLIENAVAEQIAVYGTDIAVVFEVDKVGVFPIICAVGEVATCAVERFQNINTAASQAVTVCCGKGVFVGFNGSEKLFLDRIGCIAVGSGKTVKLGGMLTRPLDEVALDRLYARTVGILEHGIIAVSLRGKVKVAVDNVRVEIELLIERYNAEIGVGLRGGATDGGVDGESDNALGNGIITLRDDGDIGRSLGLLVDLALTCDIVLLQLGFYLDFKIGGEVFFIQRDCALGIFLLGWRIGWRNTRKKRKGENREKNKQKQSFHYITSKLFKVSKGMSEDFSK